MALMLASKRSAFFQNYDFQFDPHATLHTEFRRLAKYRKWKQGSKSKIFEKAWDRYFSPEVPVGFNINRRQNRNGAQHKVGDNELYSMLHSLQSLDIEGRRSKRKIQAQRVGPEFASHYGSCQISDYPSNTTMPNIDLKSSLLVPTVISPDLPHQNTLALASTHNTAPRNLSTTLRACIRIRF